MAEEEIVLRESFSSLLARISPIVSSSGTGDTFFAEIRPADRTVLQNADVLSNEKLGGG